MTELTLDHPAGTYALLARSGTTIRIRLRGFSLARLIALPLLAAGAWCLYVAGLSVIDVARGIAAERDMLAGQLVFLAFGLACGVPGAIVLLARAHVDIDKTLGRVTAVRRFGPIRFAKTAPLACIQQVRTTVDYRSEVTVYNVELVGMRLKEPILVGVSPKRARCQAFAKELASTLNVRFEDLSDAEPDAQ